MSVKQKNLLTEIRQLLEIVYVKYTTEFIKFIIEEIGIDNLNIMVKTSINGGQNYLKVIINVFDPKNHYSSSEIYEDSGVKRCYILAIAFQNWLKTHYILMRGYHGVGLDGSNPNRFMSLLDFLERDVTITAAINILPIIVCVNFH